MRKFLKKNILEMIRTMFEAHGNIKEFIDEKEYEGAQIVLCDCQDIAVQIGNTIETSEGEGGITISFLEQYCESVYEVAMSFSDEYSGNEAQKKLDEKLSIVENSVRNDIKVKLEIVFLPYKASMWDSLESIWQAANEDSGCNSYVIPIPYYDKKTNGSLDVMYYEGEDFPDYVPITHYESYNIEQMRPDVVFIHNPYDQYNKVTSVDPRYYSFNLKKYTDQLIYIPYYVLHSGRAKGIVWTNAVCCSDRVFVQNETVREWYFSSFEEIISKDELDRKVKVIGSPKIDKMVNCLKEHISYPDEWIRNINGRKVVFMNTNISLILNKPEHFIEDMKRIFSIFKKYKEEWAVLWREHPLTMSTIKSMQPGLLNDYIALKQEFLNQGIGFLDESSDPYQAMLISDCYYGSGGSLLVVYGVSGKPALITSYQSMKKIANDKISIQSLKESLGARFFYRERNVNTLDAFLTCFDELDSQRMQRLNAVKCLITNMDGTVGRKIYESVKGDCLG